MKKLLFLALIGLSLVSCKKAVQQRTITVTTSGISIYTTYTIIVKDNNSGTTLLSIATNQSNGNTTYSLTANSGDVLNAQYTFYTQGQQYGQGNLDFAYGTQNLYHANGGSGQNIIINVP